MKKIIRLIIVILFLSTNLYAQDIKVSNFNNLGIKYSDDLINVVSSDKNNFIFCYRHGDKGYKFLKVDKNFNNINFIKIRNIIENKKIKIIELIKLEQKVFVIYSIQNKGHKKEYIFITELDQNTLKMDKATVKIGSINIPEKNQTLGDFNLSLSENGKYLCVIMREPVTIEDKDFLEKVKYTGNLSGLTISGVVIDKNLKEINAFKNRSIISESGKKMTFVKNIIDNYGNIYVVGGTPEFIIQKKIIYKRPFFLTLTPCTFSIKKFDIDKSEKTYNVEKNTHLDLDIVMDNNNDILSIITLKGKNYESKYFSVGLNKIDLDADDMEEFNSVFSGFATEFKGGYITKDKSHLIKNLNGYVHTPNDDVLFVESDDLEDEDNDLIPTLFLSISIAKIDKNGSFYVVLEESQPFDVNSALIGAVRVMGRIAFVKFDNSENIVIQNFVDKINFFYVLIVPITDGYLTEDGLIVFAQNSLINVSGDLSDIKCSYILDNSQDIKIKNKTFVYINHKIVENKFCFSRYLKYPSDYTIKTTTD